MQPDFRRKSKPIVVQQPKYSADSNLEKVGALSNGHNLQLEEEKMKTLSSRSNIVQSVARDT